MDIDALIEGLHESVVTRDLATRVAADLRFHADLASVDEADQAHVLSRHVAERVRRYLASIRDADRRLAATNELLEALEALDGAVEAPVRQLLSVRKPDVPGTVPRFASRPKTPLNDTALLTNAHGEPSLASELRAELASADSVDLLCAFVMWHGLRLLEKSLQDAHEANVPLRIITTTYLGGTQREALDRLVRDFGAEVRIQYDAARTSVGRHVG